MNRIKKAFENTANKLSQEMIHAKGEWLDLWAKKYLPEEIYALAQKGDKMSGSERRILRRAMDDAKLEVREMPEITEMWKDGKKVGAMRIVNEGGHVKVLAKDFTQDGEADLERN